MTSTHRIGAAPRRPIPADVDFPDALLEGLSTEPKRIACKYFYDAEGASLFQRICALPEYYLTRTEDYEKAIQRAEELVATSKPDLQAFGYAGLVVANVHLGDDEQAVYANQRLTPEMRDLLDRQAPRMVRLLDEALDELADPGL